MSPQEHPHEIALRHTGPSAHPLLTDGSPSTARLQEGPPRAEHAAPTPLYREIDSTTMTHAKNDVAAERPRRFRERETEREPFYGRGRRGELVSVILCARPFTGCSHSPNHIQRYHVKTGRGKKFSLLQLPCRNLISVSGSLNWSFFVLFPRVLSGGTHEAGEDCRTFPCSAAAP